MNREYIRSKYNEVIKDLGFGVLEADWDIGVGRMRDNIHLALQLLHRNAKDTYSKELEAKTVLWLLNSETEKSFRVYVACPTVDNATIAGWTEISTSSDDKCDTDDDVADLFKSKHPVSNKMLIEKDNYFAEFEYDPKTEKAKFVNSVRKDFAEYRFI